MFDFDNQHYYNRDRSCCTYNGRFNRTDPYAGNTQDPQSLHKYLYCHNNPINATDPTGNSLEGGSYTLGEVVTISALIATLTGIVVYNTTGSKSAAVIISVSIFLMAFIGLGGLGLLKAAVFGGVVTSPQLLNPSTWQEAESMLGKVLNLPKNTITYYYDGMTRGGIPDFIDCGNKCIHESKWVQELYMTDQLRNYAILAEKWGYSIYIYVREGTTVGSNVVKLAEATGGAVIGIFK